MTVIDQARADYLDRFQSYFGQSGFRRFFNHGAVYTDARYRHAVTFTEPGHASVSTGVDPKEHGIVANRWFDRVKNQSVYCVDDPSVHEVSSDPIDPRKKSYSPVDMMVETVGDHLKDRWNDSRVAFLTSPFGNDLLLDYAYDLVKRFHLGANSSGHPDMLFVASSSLDYCGHAFGPDSKEVAEFIVSLDRSLQSFMSHFPAGSTLFFITADHGVTPIPEVTLAKNSVGGRINLEASGTKISAGSPMRTSLEQTLAQNFHYPLDPDRSFAQEGAVLCFYEPYLYLNRTVLNKRGVTLEAAQRAIKNWLLKQPGIQQVITRDEITHGTDRRSMFGDMVDRSFQSERSGHFTM